MTASRLQHSDAPSKCLFSIGLSSERLDQLDDLAPDLAIGNLHEGTIELQPFGRGQEIDDVVGAGCFGQAPRGGRVLTRSVFEEEGDRDIENGGDILETAGANAVGALFVFLDLLKRDSETFAELLLAHAKHRAAEAYAATDMNVDGVRLFFVLNHHFTLT